MLLLLKPQLVKLVLLKWMVTDSTPTIGMVVVTTLFLCLLLCICFEFAMDNPDAANNLEICFVVLIILALTALYWLTMVYLFAEQQTQNLGK